MTNLTMVVRDSHDLDLAKRFTRACLRAGLLREVRPRVYVKPGERRRRKSKVARAKIAKAERRRAASEAAWLQSRGQTDD
jgi:ribosomal protein S21